MPLVNVMVPPTFTFPPNVTPLELLIVKLLYMTLPDARGDSTVTVCEVDPL